MTYITNQGPTIGLSLFYLFIPLLSQASFFHQDSSQKGKKNLHIFEVVFSFEKKKNHFIY